ncbi:hypothetical protein CERZMDRAFT_96988 [Cercospora zeae-maydis SCOH1-5]|uniref:Uncharacterized protein n=1 Tax=Cercospora zeae-maydis SCOH1-5 TaxID=717836 RepID=A0A6A6FIT7_9PEZI|nr:hypothetical protein CERZMDRAFT_96988 [Cercospora zeae-maydis SCOH1-5]
MSNANFSHPENPNLTLLQHYNRVVVRMKKSWDKIHYNPYPPSPSYDYKRTCTYDHGECELIAWTRRRLVWDKRSRRERTGLFLLLKLVKRRGKGKGKGKGKMMHGTRVSNEQENERDSHVVPTTIRLLGHSGVVHEQEYRQPAGSKQSQPPLGSQNPTAVAGGQCKFCDFFQDMETLRLEQKVPSLVQPSKTTTVEQVEEAEEVGTQGEREEMSKDCEHEHEAEAVEPQPLSDIGSEEEGEP